MTTSDRKSAFLHVINDHRWLAAAGCAWNLVGPDAAEAPSAAANDLLPNIGVMVQDSLLMHARSLFKFYRNVSKDNTDIILRDFGVPSVGRRLEAELQQYENAIEVHLLHLTDWRDSNYRNAHPSGRGITRGRPDWNRQAAPIVELLLQALDHASQQSGSWTRPFKELYDAAYSRYRNKSFPWPVELAEKVAVERHLQELGH